MTRFIKKDEFMVNGKPKPHVLAQIRSAVKAKVVHNSNCQFYVSQKNEKLSYWFACIAFLGGEGGRPMQKEKERENAQRKGQ